MGYLDRAKVFYYMLIIIGGSLIISSLFRENIKSKDDLKNISAIFENSVLRVIQKRNSHSFSTRLTYSYYVHLYKYSNDFMVVGDFEKDFLKAAFEKEVHAGDTISIQVSERGFNMLNTKRIIRIFGISTNKATYMDCNRSIEEYNKSGYILLGFVLLIAGVFFLKRIKDTR